MRIYTRGGDKGKTGIHGGERVDKDDIRIEANGTLDELNAEIGIVRTLLPPPRWRITGILSFREAHLFRRTSNWPVRSPAGPNAACGH